MLKFSECKKWLVAGSAMMFAFACQCQTNNKSNTQCSPPPPKNDCSPCEKPKPAPCPSHKEECCPKPKSDPCCENEDKGSASEEKVSTVEAVKAPVEPVAEKSLVPESQNKVEAVVSTTDAKTDAAVEAKAELPTPEPVAAPSLPVNAAVETPSSSSETAQK